MVAVIMSTNHRKILTCGKRDFELALCDLIGDAEPTNHRKILTCGKRDYLIELNNCNNCVTCTAEQHSGKGEMTAALMYTALLLWLSLPPIFMRQCCMGCNKSKKLLMEWASTKTPLFGTRLRKSYATVVGRLANNTNYWGIEDSLDKQFNMASLKGFKTEQASICFQIAKHFYYSPLELRNFISNFFSYSCNQRRGQPRWYTFKIPSQDARGKRKPTEEPKETPAPKRPRPNLSAIFPDLQKEEELRTAESCLNEESSDSISNDEWIDGMECGNEGPWAEFEDVESETMYWPVAKC